jgi:hypothetical protein
MIGIVFEEMRPSLDCHNPGPPDENLVGRHEGDGGMTVGDGVECGQDALGN